MSKRFCLGLLDIVTESRSECVYGRLLLDDSLTITAAIVKTPHDTTLVVLRDCVTRQVAIRAFEKINIAFVQSMNLSEDFEDNK